MARLRAHNIGISLDGFATGEGQSFDTPFGHAGTRLMDWFFPTPTFQLRTGHRERAKVDLATEPDDIYARRAWDGIGAEIMGAGKFGPPGWHEDTNWRGWWGENPPFHTPVFVLTHWPRPTLELEEGNVFHFIDASPEKALKIATEAADGQDVRLGGGPTSISEFVEAGLVDYLHVVVSPIVLGRGVNLWENLEGFESGYNVTAETTPSGVTHIVFER